MTPPTFARPWHPAEVFNGPMTLQAMGLDAAGKMIASSPLVHFSARVGPGDMKLDAPKDLTKPLAGVVRFTVTAIRPLTAAERKQREEDPKFDKSQMGKTVECVQFFVDGQGALRQFGAPPAPWSWTPPVCRTVAMNCRSARMPGSKTYRT